MTSLEVNFDLIARPYRWLEYFSFGPFLDRCRRAQLVDLKYASRALVLGDGDGRFLARLLAVNPSLSADVVDSSASMLKVLERRVDRSGSLGRRRIRLYHADALDWKPTGNYDLIVTHFFLDCFSPLQLKQLVDRILPHATPGAKWLISEFAIPGNPIAAPFARAIISLLYRAFGCLTGLPVRALPDYAAAFSRRGMVLSQERRTLAGLLSSQIWTLPDSRQ
jgi:SAM-dependent methyltransferase